MNYSSAAVLGCLGFSLARSDFHVLTALQREDLACFIGRCDLEAELLENSPDLRDLFGVRGGELAAADVKGVLETDADVSAHHRRLRYQRHLLPAGREHRPDVVAAEEAVGGTAHERDVVRIGADAA